MPLGFLVRLGTNAQLGAGDLIVGERTGFNTQTSLGNGSWTWSGTNTANATVTNQVVNGSYFLATDGSVYFVPNTQNVGTLTSASATTAPAFDDRTFGTAAANTMLGDSGQDMIYGGTDTTGTSTGTDTIHAGAGNDQIFSGDGNDTVTVDSAITLPALVMPHIKAGKLRALASTGATRINLLPICRQSWSRACPGMSDYSAWAAMFAPGGSPVGIVEKLQLELSIAPT